MASRDQLETVDPQGQIVFYDLDPDRGITNIGRHPENDVIIASPRVAPFHALIDHRQKPYQIMLLNDDCETTLQGQRLPANVFRELHDWDCMELDGYSLIYLEGDGAGPRAGASLARPAPAVAPVPVAAAASGHPGGVGGVDHPDDVIVTQIPQREWTLDVEQTAICDVTIINGGDIVATFVVAVEGVNPEWVTITPPQVNLHEAARASVSIAITPPRDPHSRAGAHPLTVVVTSPDHPGRASRSQARLNINPYYEFAVGDLSPRQQTVPWRKGSGLATIPISNRGNSDAPFHLAVEDDERACRFEFQVPGQEASLVRNAELRLPPGETNVVPITITPLKRRLIGMHKRTYSYTVTTTLAEGDQIPRSVMAQVSSAPLIGPLIVLLVALAIAAGIVGFFRPSANPTLTASAAATDRPNTPVTLSYDASRFAGMGPSSIFNRLNGLFLQLSLDYQLSEGQWQTVKSGAELTRPDGQVTHVPPGNGKYRLRADNVLSQLVPLLGGKSSDVPIRVTPVEPKIMAFDADRDSILVGQTVTFYWQVVDADTLILSHDGIEETLTDKELQRGQRPFTLDKDATFTLIASNSSWPQPVKLPRTIKALVPTPTPVPVPVIVRFDVAPLSITAGEKVALVWEVTGADTVSIEPLGEVPPKGEASDEPAKTARYQLTAIKDGGDGKQVKATSLLKEVVVNPAPTPTPVPVAPEVQLFEATPKEVVAGDSQLVKLAWAVNGSATNIEISGPNLALSGLKPQDVVTVTVDSTALFVFTAQNGDLKTSKAVEVKALAPTPLPTDPPPPPTPFPPPIISFFKAEAVNPGTDVVTFKGREESNGTPVFVYEVEAGSNVKFSWEVKAADKVTLVGFEDQPATGSKGLTIMEGKPYQLVAENNKGANVASAFIRVELLPLEPPPAPMSISGSEGVGGNTITWSYNRSFVEKITGFRIYRADLAKSNDFSPIMTIEDPQSRSYLDAVSPTCGQAYYVVAVYMDIFDNKEKETDASATSWYTQPCR